MNETELQCIKRISQRYGTPIYTVFFKQTVRVCSVCYQFLIVCENKINGKKENFLSVFKLFIIAQSREPEGHA